MIGVIARQDDGLHPRSPGSFAQLIRRWNQRCLNSRDKHPKFNQKQQKKSRRKRKKNISSKKNTKKQTKQHLRFTNIPTDEKDQHLRRNPQKQKNNINNKSTKRIIGLVASSFILLFLSWNSTLKQQQRIEIWNQFCPNFFPIFPHWNLESVDQSQDEHSFAAL